MDWEKINLLLDIIHKSINVPGTDVIRSEAIKALGEAAFTTPAAPTIADPQLDLKLGARRI